MFDSIHIAWESGENRKNSIVADPIGIACMDNFSNQYTAIWLLNVFFFFTFVFVRFVYCLINCYFIIGKRI